MNTADGFFVIQLTMEYRDKNISIDSELRYQSLIDTVDGVVWEADAKTLQYCFVSKSAVDILGYPLREWLDNPTFWKDHIYRGDLGKVISFFTDDPLLKNGNDVEYRMIKADGSMIYVCNKISVIVDEDKPVLLRGIIVDLTKQKKAEQQIRDNEQQLNLIYNTSVNVIFLISVEQGTSGYEFRFTSVNKAFESATGLKKDKVIRKLVSEIIPEPSLSMVLENYKKAIREHKTIQWEEVSQYPAGIKTGIVSITPIFNEEGICTMLAGTVNDITERKNMEEENSFKAELLNRIGQAVMATDLKGTINFWNKAAEQIYGWKTEEAIGKNIVDLVPAEQTKQQALEIMDALTEGHTWSGEFLVRHKDGFSFPAFVTDSPVFDKNNNLTGIIGVSKNISERKKAQQLLLDSEAKYRSFFENSLDGILLTVTDGEILAANPAACAMFNMTEQDFFEAGRYGIVDLNDPRAEALINERRKTGRAKGELTFKRKDGTTFPGEITSVMFADGRGNQTTSMIIRDLTERKRAEKQIKDSEQRYLNLFQQNLAAVYMSTVEGVLVNCNEAFAKMLKYDSPAQLIERSTMDLYFSPEVRNNLITSLKGQKKLDNYETILKCRDGSPLYIIENISLRADESTGELLFQGILINITQRKLAEMQLKESHAKYKAIVDNPMNAFLLTDANGTILDVNETTCRTLGYTREELLQLKNKDILEIDDPAYMKAVNERMKTGMTSGEVFGIKKSGERFPVNFTTSVYYTASGEQRLSSIGVDISDKKSAEEKLLKSNERFVHVSKATFDAIWELDFENKHLYLGAGFKELFGYDISNEQGSFSDWADHIHPEDKERVIENRLNKIISHHELTWKDEYRYLRSDGSVAYVSDRSILLQNDKGSYRMIGAMQDVTDLKEHEISITNLNDTLKRHADELASSNEELERYAYVTSHDLQEPLRMVTSFLQLLKSKYANQLDATALKYIDFAVDGASRMRKLILDLLEFSRISSYVEEHKQVDLNTLISATLTSLKALIDENNAVIKFASMPHVWGNESQLMQLFQNLISNAIKYKGNEAPIIDIGYTERKNEWEFYIKDNGIGIDKKFSEKIFIIFQRLHNRKDYEGTGIGLAICKKIVELHGGKIWLESSKDEGSIFYFTISKLQASADETRQTLSPGNPNN